MQSSIPVAELIYTIRFRLFALLPEGVLQSVLSTTALAPSPRP
jgi:hypothetical protein